MDAWAAYVTGAAGKVTAIYDAMSRGEFPRPFRLSPKAVRWSEAEVEEWIASLARSHGDKAA
jgi:predicted DNA-binding transcriptional regulator AlpA